MNFESLTNETKEVNAIFRKFTEKYAIPVPANWRIRSESDSNSQADLTGNADETVELTDGSELIDRINPNDTAQKKKIIPIFPWRFERRFVELAKLVAGKTVENVVMCRFSCTASAETKLAAILYREFDLLEWLNDSKIVSVYATIADGKFANVIARLENGCVCSVEAGTTLSSESQANVLDRHEMIGQRGVASDRVVDTQIPQSSVYLFEPGQTQTWTDTDAELFGLPAAQINQIRAANALAALLNTDKLSADRQWDQHDHLCGWVTRAFESDKWEENRKEGDRQ